MLCYVMLCYVMLCYVMLYYFMLCYVVQLAVSQAIAALNRRTLVEKLVPVRCGKVFDAE